MGQSHFRGYLVYRVLFRNQIRHVLLKDKIDVSAVGPLFVHIDGILYFGCVFKTAEIYCGVPLSPVVC